MTLPALLAGDPAPRGDGRVVLVIPGYLATDGSTAVLRRWLRHLGYDARGWGLGRNDGVVGRAVERLAQQVEGLPAPVSVVGWSLGGVVARELARRVPARIDRVITLGTPVAGGPRATRFAALYRLRGQDLDAIEAAVAKRNARPVPVPITAIYSRRDGVVAWQACLDPWPHNRCEAVEVGVGHYGLCHSRVGLRAVAEALARPGP